MRVHEFLLRVRTRYCDLLPRIHVAMGELTIDDLVELAMVDPYQPSTLTAFIKPLLLLWQALS